MPCIYHERQQKSGNRRKCRGHQADGGKLHRTGVDKRTHEKRPEDGKTVFGGQDAERSTEKKIAEHNGDCVGNGSPQRFSFHKNSNLLS